MKPTKKGKPVSDPIGKRASARGLMRADHADHYHVRDAVQFTHLHMQTISFEEAEDLAEAITREDFSGRYEDTPDLEPEGVMLLTRLILGIAAYEDAEWRQICAEYAVRRLFAVYTNAGRKGLTEFVARVNAELGEEGGGEQ